MKRLKYLGSVLLISILGATSAFSSDDRVTLRAGIGFPIKGTGSAVMLGAGYMVKPYLEVNGIYLKSTLKESRNNGFNNYNEKTDVTVFGAVANYFHNYNPGQEDFYFITGAGAALIMVEYEESSPTDGSLGVRLPGGGSIDKVDGSTIGLVANIGIGRTLNEKMDIRLEVPVFVQLDPPGDTTGVAVAILLSVGYKI